MASAAATRALTWRVATTAPGAADWRTPPAIYLALDTEFNFTLDAAASVENAVEVRCLTLDTDALAVPWAGERVFVNPPYGRGLGAWTRKARYETTEGACALVVMLLPARTDTAWFHDVVLPCAEIRFIRGRLGYTRGGAGRRRAPFASLVAVFRRPGAGQLRGVRQLLFPFLPKQP